MSEERYLEIPLDRGWEVWLSSDDQEHWTVELVRFADPVTALASKPRPLGARVFESPPVALTAVRAALFGEVPAPTDAGRRNR